MTDQLLHEVLEATGYLVDGHPAHGVRMGADAHAGDRTRSFRPDALWKGDSALTVYFKSEPEVPSGKQVAGWHREIWNQGFAPLLWVVSPEKIELYNGFGRPRQTGNAAEHLLDTFERIESRLKELDAFAGRLAMETGRFWQEPEARKVDRKTSVDRQLLSDLAALERDLVDADMSRPDAQGLIGRSIFTQYLIDRRIVTTRHLAKVYGRDTLAAILRDRRATKRLFDWLRETFNGDMFPSGGSSAPRAGHLRRVADFLEAVDPDTGQMTFFPYQFDVIPVELISSIYEQFARSDSPTRDDEQPARSDSSVHNDERSLRPDQPARDVRHGTDVFYTRLPLVSLVLDEITDGLIGKETILDLTCGSGVFLVEALRRLVHIRSGGAEPNRRLIRSTLHEQIYGVDISEAAVRVAAFSLYLAALELDPDPKPPRALKFKPLIGKTLIVGDARNVEQTADGQAALTERGKKRRFDVIVGNPPWSYGGKEATAARRDEGNRGKVHAPRGESLGFVSRAMEFASGNTRFGLILSAVQFFSRSGTGAAASRQIIEKLSPVTLVNLSSQSDWLFPNANMPAVALFARHRPAPAGTITTVQVPWSPGGARSHTFEIAPSDIVTPAIGRLEKKAGVPEGGAARVPARLGVAGQTHVELYEAGRWDPTNRRAISYGIDIRRSKPRCELSSQHTTSDRERTSVLLRTNRFKPIQCGQGGEAPQPRYLSSPPAARQRIPSRRNRAPHRCRGDPGYGLHRCLSWRSVPNKTSQDRRHTRRHSELVARIVVLPDERIRLRSVDATDQA